MSYIKQFKIFMWKNWKIFRQRSIAFIIGAEIVVSVVLVFTFGKIFLIIFFYIYIYIYIFYY